MFAVTYRQLLTDLSLAALLAAPTFALTRPTPDQPVSASTAGKALSATVTSAQIGARPHLG